MLFYDAAVMNERAKEIFRGKGMKPKPVVKKISRVTQTNGFRLPQGVVDEAKKVVSSDNS
jgi:hypothetical protein